MKIILATCGNGYCGCESEDVFFYYEENGITEAEINDDIYDWACSNAESFSYVHFGWCEPYTDEEYDDYLENYMTYDWREATYEEYVEWCENWGYEPKTAEELV